jgi:hypothetical protein
VRKLNNLLCVKVKVKVKRYIYRPKAQGRVDVWLYPFVSIGDRRSRVASSTPRPLYLQKKTRYALCRRLGGPQGRSERVWKISPLPGFGPRTVQPVASRCTDYAIPAPSYV